MSRAVKQLALTQEQVEYLASIGCTDEEIAHTAGVSRRTIQRRCGAALKKGRASFRIELRKAQINLALRGNASMLIWLGKQYLGQRDRHDVYTEDLSELSDEELRAIVNGASPRRS